MTFLNPIYLWSLLGVIIPLAIHLWSRRKVVKIKVGSTKLLQESEPRHTSTLRLNELWLLFLRMLTILLLSLIISEPRFERGYENDSLLYIIEPSLIANKKNERLFEEIPEESIRLLTTDFPKLEDYEDLEIFKNKIPDYWQLAYEMNTLPADSIIVLTEGFILGIKGKRPVTSSHIKWRVLNSAEGLNQVVEVRKKGDSLELISVLSNPEQLQFERGKVSQSNKEVKYSSEKDSVEINESTLPITIIEPIRIVLIYQDSLIREQQYISAAYKSIEKFIDRPINIVTTGNSDTVNIDSYDLSIWLGVPPSNDFDGIRLIFKEDPLASELIEKGTFDNEYFLTSFLNSENIVSEHLPEKLIVLLNLYSELEEKVEIFDKRVVSDEELSPAISEKKKTAQQAGFIDISKWLWILLLFVLILERTLAKYRKQ